MDTQTPTDKNQTNLYLMFALVLVLILGGLAYLFFFTKSPIPNAFFTKYQQQDTTAKTILSAIVYDYPALSKAIQSQDATGAAALAKQDLVQSLKNQTSLSAVRKKTAELKVVSGQITDNTLRDKVIKLMTLLDERNTKLSTVLGIQTNIFTVLRDNYGAFSVGEKANGVPQNIDSVIQGSQAQMQEVKNLQTTIDVGYDEIIKLAGVDPSVFQTVDLIKTNLSATPEKEPSITDFPTPTAKPTLAPTSTPIPEASSSAQTSTASAQ